MWQWRRFAGIRTRLQGLWMPVGQDIGMSRSRMPKKTRAIAARKNQRLRVLATAPAGRKNLAPLSILSYLSIYLLIL